MNVIRKIVFRKKGASPVFEVTRVHGDNYIVNRWQFENYRRAAKFVREELKSSKHPGRYMITEVIRQEMFYSNVGTTKPIAARRLIETVQTRGWNMEKKPSKKGGIFI